MTKREFTINIQAPRATVWFALWDLYHYRQWTAAFSEGSYAVTDGWKEGSRVHFLTPDGQGMYSTVAVNNPLNAMHFAHIGMLKEFKEMPLDDETRLWTGSQEQYALCDTDGGTQLTVTIDVYEPYIDYFEEVFPIALQRVKEQSEQLWVTVEVDVNVPISKAWAVWNSPTEMTKWYVATSTWHTPTAHVNLQVGGQMGCRMEAKDGSMGFDLLGTFTGIIDQSLIAYTLEGGRRVRISFADNGTGGTLVTESCEAEDENSLELQRDGWQAILNNFKVCCEE